MLRSNPRKRLRIIVYMMGSVLFASQWVGSLASGSQNIAVHPSARHQEWVQIPQGNRTVYAFLVLPDTKDKALAVIIIHENRGLTEWVQSVADRIAEAGYVAIAPDLLSGMGPNGGKTSDFPSEDAAINAISQLPQTQVNADLNAVADYIKDYSASNGKLAVAGFCWGGGQSFTLATRRSDLSAAFVFYGSPPGNPAEIAKINCPVYGFYGGNDSRITSTVPKTAEQMKAASKKFDPITYAGAGHAFMRLGEDPGAIDANKKARDAAWIRWVNTLKGLQSFVRWGNQ